jgi:hypothetical protein
MILHHIIQTIFVIAGATALAAAILDWEWFFASANAEFIVKRLGRKRSRLIYGSIGVLFIAAAAFFYYKVEALK